MVCETNYACTLHIAHCTLHIAHRTLHCLPDEGTWCNLRALGRRAEKERREDDLDACIGDICLAVRSEGVSGASAARMLPTQLKTICLLLLVLPALGFASLSTTLDEVNDTLVTIASTHSIDSFHEYCR